jgi:Na+:H+ antiporter, NhaA family
MARGEGKPRVRAPRRFPRPWLHSERPTPRRVVRPLDRFLSKEAGSGSLLLAAAILALLWANLASGSYDDFWSTHVHVELGSLSLSEDLRHVVNDLLMAVFFYVIALEVKREMLFGSLRDRATAAVPVAAALGTMVGAAVAYLAVNLSGGEPSGWAIPIATDIAFALAVLGVAGRSAPPELRAFLLTLAVVDDIGTIAVIAVFFSGGIVIGWLAEAMAVVAAIVLLQRLSVRMMAPYVLAAGLLWLGFFESGVHATIAGVVLGFLTPARPFHPSSESGQAIAEQLRTIDEHPDTELNEGAMWRASRLAREAVSPLARMEEQLHSWSAYVVLPLFALANAGVAVSAAALGDVFTSQVGLGIILGLVLGAPLGGIFLALAAVRLSGARLQSGLSWPAVASVAPLKGIGFTVAIFISLLAFEDRALQEQATLAVLVASAIAGLIGSVALRLLTRAQPGS